MSCPYCKHKDLDYFHTRWNTKNTFKESRRLVCPNCKRTIKIYKKKSGNFYRQSELQEHL